MAPRGKYSPFLPIPQSEPHTCSPSCPPHAHRLPRACPSSPHCVFLCSRCDLCCCLIPCLFDDFKDVTHTCPNCKAYIYTYKRMC